MKTDATLRAICRAAFPDYTGRKFKVAPLSDPEKPINIWSCWDDGSRDYFAFVALREGMPASAQVPACNPLLCRSAAEHLVQLPKGIVCVRRTYFCGKEVGCTVICRPDDLNPHLLGE